MLSTRGSLACCRCPAARRERSLKYPAEPVLSSASFSHRPSLWAAPPITLSPLYGVERPPVGVTCCAESAGAINKTQWTSNRDAAILQGIPPCSEGRISLSLWSVKDKVFSLKKCPVYLFLYVFSGCHPDSEISINDCQLVYDLW